MSVSHTWTVTINYGSGDVALHNYSSEFIVRAASFRKTETLHKDLKPVQDKCTFTVDYKQSLANTLLTLSYDQIITVSITKNGNDWFTGIIRPVTDYTINPTANQIDFECLDNSYKLKKRPTNGVTYSSQTVTQIMTAILTDAGYTSTERADIPTISPTLNYLSYQGDKRDYWDILHDLLYSYGYVFYFDESGVFQAHQWRADSVTTTGSISDGGINGELGVERDDIDYDTVRVSYYATEIKFKTLVNHVTADTYSDSVPERLTAGEVFPANGSTTHYFDDGDETAEVLAYSNWVFSSEIRYGWFTAPKIEIYSYSSFPVSNDEAVKTVSINEADGSAEIQFQYYAYPGSSVIHVNWYKLITWVHYRKKGGSVTYPTTGTENRLKEVDLKTVYDTTTAQRLATALYNRLTNSVYKYRFRSSTEFTVAQYIDLTNTALNINTDVRVVKKTYRYNKAVDTWEYECEGVAPIDSLLGTVTGATYGITPSTTDLQAAIDSSSNGLTPGGNLISPIIGNIMDLENNFSPGENGLFFTPTDIGFYDDGTDTWPVRIQNDSGTGKFKVGNTTKYVEWDGTDLNVQGAASISGTVAVGDDLTVDGDIIVDQGKVVAGTVQLSGDTIDINSGAIVIDGTSGAEVITVGANSELQMSASNRRYSFFDAVNNEKGIFGYLDSTINDPEGNPYTSNDFGLYVAAGNVLHIESGGEFVTGDYFINYDAAYLVLDSARDEIVRLGSIGAGDVGFNLGKFNTIRRLLDAEGRTVLDTNDDTIRTHEYDYTAPGMYFSIDDELLKLNADLQVGSKLDGTTLISGGYINANLIDVVELFAEAVTIQDLTNDRIIELGGNKGIRATDANSNVTHDLPAANLTSDVFYIGHLYFIQDYKLIYNPGDYTSGTWETGTINSQGHDNIRAVYAQVLINVTRTGTPPFQIGGSVSFRRPGTAPGENDAIAFANKYTDITSIAEYATVIIPVINNQFEFFALDNFHASQSLSFDIRIRGFFI